MKNEVSVVIPVYNGENYIVRAVNSVLSQTLKPSEIIVVDDGSNDKTNSLLKQFGESVKVISIPNSGVANARNVGIQAASKEYIAFLDADDFWDRDKLKIQLDFLERFPNVGFSCCNYYVTLQPHSVKSTLFNRFFKNKKFNFDEPLKTDPFTLLLETNFVGTCSNVIFKRDLIDYVGWFDVELKQAEDFDFWLKLSFVTDFILISKPLVEKFTHESNLTNNFLETLQFREKVLVNLKKNQFANKKLIQHIKKYQIELARCRYRIAVLFYKKNLKWQSIKYFLSSLSTILNRS